MPVLRFGVLVSQRSWYWRDLSRAAAGRCELVPLSFERLAARLLPDGATCRHAADDELARCHGLLVRTMPPGSLEQVVFRMDVLGRLAALPGLVVNPPRALEVAVDKFLASALMAAAGLPVPRTVVCQTVDDALAGYEALGGDVVIKPLFGSEGRGILRVEDPALAERVVKAIVQLGGVVYLQEFVPHAGYDLRVFLLGSEAWGMRRSNPHDWRTNVSRGAVTAPFTPSPEMLDLARRAAAAIGAPVAGVDLLPARDGRLLVLEVNAVPGWRALARTVDVDIAARLLDYLQSASQSFSGSAG